MPIVEQSGIRLEYPPVGDEIAEGEKKTVELRALVTPPHVNNQVWFIYRIDEGQWLRRRANRTSSRGGQERYAIAVDVSAGGTRLTYGAFVRRGPIVVPRGADLASREGTQGLKEFTVDVSLARDDGGSLEPEPAVAVAPGENEVGRPPESAVEQKVTVTNMHRNQPILFHYLGGSTRLGPLETQELERDCLASPELEHLILTGAVSVSESSSPDADRLREGGGTPAEARASADVREGSGVSAAPPGE